MTLTQYDYRIWLGMRIRKSMRMHYPAPPYATPFQEDLR